MNHEIIELETVNGQAITVEGELTCNPEECFLEIEKVYDSFTKKKYSQEWLESEMDLKPWQRLEEELGERALNHRVELDIDRKLHWE